MWSWGDVKQAANWTCHAHDERLLQRFGLLASLLGLAAVTMRTTTRSTTRTTSDACLPRARVKQHTPVISLSVSGMGIASL